MHVSRLRRKLAPDGTPDDRVKTVRGTGYQLVLRRASNSGRG
jgi:two-component system response regulator CpxR